MDGRRAGDVPASAAPGASLQLAAGGPEAGWGMVSGTGLVPDTRCWSDGRWTVLATPAQAAALPPFVEALRRADGTADRLLEPPDHRLLVLLGEPERPPMHHFTSIPSGWLEGDLGYVAAYAVASERLRAAPVTRDRPGETAMFEALARSLVPRPPKELLAAMEPGDVTAWTDAVKACKGGWRALAAGACRVPGPAAPEEPEAFELP